MLQTICRNSETACNAPNTSCDFDAFFHGDTFSSVWLGQGAISPSISNERRIREFFLVAPTQLGTWDTAAVATGVYFLPQILAERVYSLRLKTKLNRRVAIISDVKVVAEQKWLGVAYSRRDELPLGKMGEIVDDLTRLFNAGRFDEVNQSLCDARPEIMSVDAITAISRLSYSARSRLKYLPDFLTRARNSLKERGADSRVLAGLD